jgi:hypothetical protein
MSAKQWALSAFFVCHVIATGLGAFQLSGFDLTVGPPRYPANDRLAATLTPLLDSSAAVVAPALDGLLHATRPIGRLAAAYLDITALGQNWKMFSVPPAVHEYLKVRYYIGRREPGGPTSSALSWTATELIMPAYREDEMRLRLFGAYRDSFRDKAMSVALQRFRGNRDQRLLRPDTTSAELPDDLAPIGRYFASRFEREALGPDERILRTDIWYGAAPIPPPGTIPDRDATDRRWSVLREYYDGPVEDHFGRPVYPVYHAGETEADITWILEYFEP